MMPVITNSLPIAIRIGDDVPASWTGFYTTKSKNRWLAEDNPKPMEPSVRRGHDLYDNPLIERRTKIDTKSGKTFMIFPGPSIDFDPNNEYDQEDKPKLIYLLSDGQRIDIKYLGGAIKFTYPSYEYTYFWGGCSNLTIVATRTWLEINKYRIWQDISKADITFEPAP